jgi:hypothetical protein
MHFVYQKTEDGQYLCPICKQTKKNQNTMHYHLKKHAGDLNHSCKDCDAKFLHASQLKNHVLVFHTDPDKVAKLRCPHPNCNFQTLTKSNRIIHYLRKHCDTEVAKLLSIQKRAEGSSVYHCNSCEQNYVSNTSFCYHTKECLKLEDPQRQAEFRSIV